MQFRTKLIGFLSLALISTQSILVAQIPFPELGPIYTHQTVPRIDIAISKGHFNAIMAFGNEESDIHYPATFYFDNGTIKDTLEEVGFRLRGNTSRYTHKRSFKISLNTFHPGRKWYGVEKLNLNGEHNDPTISRSKICWELLRRMGISAPRSNHVRLYINGDFYGVYANVEHIDEEFVNKRFGSNDGNLYKCLWPVDMTYQGDDPDLYKYMQGNRRAFELKTNVEQDDYSDLAHLIDVLNNTPIDHLACELEPIFNVNSFLKTMVFDILTGNWDGPLYNKNNFYLYHNPFSDQFELIPYDLDNTFGVDFLRTNWAERNIFLWGHAEQPRPLYWRILEVPEYLLRFSHYMDQTIQSIYTEEAFTPFLDSTLNLLKPYVELDPYYPLQYGFDIHDFIEGFTEQVPYNHTKNGIKDFIATRRHMSMIQIPLYEISPIISNAQVNQLGSSPYISVSAHVEDNGSVEYVEFCYKTHPEAAFICEKLYDDGKHGDGIAGDGQYGIELTVDAEQIHFMFRSSDNLGNQIQSPPCGTSAKTLFQFAMPLAINEFLASNKSVHTDDHGEPDDWIELHNYGDSVIHLAGLYLSDNPFNPTKWPLPDTFVEPGGYLVVWADDDPEQGPLHAPYKLNADGEYIGIFHNDAHEHTLIDGIQFGHQQPDQVIGRLPNGNGPWQFLEPTPGRSNQPLTTSSTNRRTQTGFVISPNPARSFFNLRSLGPVDRDVEVKLFDTAGMLVSQKLWEPQMHWDISNLSPGLYVIVAQNNGEVILSSKVVVK